MGKIFLRLWFCAACIFLSGLLFAQDSTESVNDIMRSNNKIYVVMAVCLTILIGLILYLIRIDRKVSRREKELT